MLRVASIDLRNNKVNALAIPVCKDQNIHDDAIIKQLVKKAFKLDEFSGENGQVVTLYDIPGLKPNRIILYGLGELETIDSEALRCMAGRTVKNCIKKKLPDLWFAVPDSPRMKIEISSTLKVMQEGAFLGNHIFSKYKAEKKQKPLKRINFRVAPNLVSKLRRISSRVIAVCRGTNLAREWVSTPSNEKTPEKFTRSIANIARKNNLKVQVLKETQLKQKKLGALLAVAAGSQSKPSLVMMEHRVTGAKMTAVLVGKGVTFDSGGLNIKTGASISDMKSDMAGAAAVAATMITAAQMKTKLNIIGVIPIVENMPSGKATRPGDVIRSYAGKTIEIGNTDAEGRLILIDAISYAVKKYRPHILIDLATLTGACVVALGEKIAGVFSNDDELAESVVTSGENTHERCWRMPLPEDYKELLKSDFADMNNMSSTRWGGAVTAALFISEFIGDTRWAHIDIAGPAYNKKESDYCGPGGTGFGVRLLSDLFEKLGQ